MDGFFVMIGCIFLAESYLWVNGYELKLFGNPKKREKEDTE